MSVCAAAVPNTAAPATKHTPSVTLVVMLPLLLLKPFYHQAFRPSNHQELQYYTQGYRDGVDGPCIQGRRLEAPNGEAGLSGRLDNAQPVQALATPKQ